MVTSYYIMKMSTRRQKQDIEEYYSSIFDNTRSTGEDKCRICLRDGSVQIHGNEDTPGLAQALLTFADVDINVDNGYPKNLCTVCYEFIRGAILFRNTAKLTEAILEKPVKLENATSLNLEDDFEDTGVFDQSPTSRDDVKPVFEESSLKMHKSKRISTKNSTFTKEKLPSKVTCNICKKVYDRKYYKNHLTMHDPNHEKEHVCEVCGKGFRLKSMYYGHRKLHQSDFPFKCSQCPYRARQKHILKLHTSTHTEDYKYTCTECPARFHFVSNLNIHILKKHREPQLKCDSCDRTFHRQITMQRHFEADHLGLKNHLCNICGKAFGYRGAMMKHQRGVHKREKLMSGVTPAYIRVQMENDNSAYSFQCNPTTL